MLNHRIFQICLTGLGACLLSMAAAGPAQAQEGIGERIGAQLDRGIDRLNEEFSQGWESLQQAVDKMGVQGRVYSRLRWDKQLVQSEFDIEVEDGGIVTLRGRVPTPAAKQKAITLAKDTVGVNRIVDDLRVESSGEEAAR